MIDSMVNVRRIVEDWAPIALRTAIARLLRPTFIVVTIEIIIIAMMMPTIDVM